MRPPPAASSPPTQATPASTQNRRPTPATSPTKSLPRIQHTQRLNDLETIKPSRRRALYRKGLGYRYQEIMQITGATYTAVNRRLTEGRRAVRKLEHNREHAPNTEQLRNK